jgi:hypothetical protein
MHPSPVFLNLIGASQASRGWINGGLGAPGILRCPVAKESFFWRVCQWNAAASEVQVLSPILVIVQFQSCVVVSEL